MPPTGDDLPAGLVTFLFTDVESSTRLHERLGEAYALLIRRHDELLGGIVREHGGAVVKSLGDGLFAAFPGARAAVEATAAIQGAVAAEDWNGVELRVRAGLHVGAAQPHDGDYSAIAVHVAARVSAAAHGGQVLVSEDVVSAAGPPPDGTRWTDLGQFALAGLDAPVRLVHLDDGTAFPAPRAVPVARHNVPTVRTTFVGRERELAELTGLLTAHRLVSILGPGGAGKTRLSYELARRMSTGHRDGAWVVLLADLPPGGEVMDRVATTLGVRPVLGRDVRESLADWCATHEALIVLDNCEHVTDNAADVAETLLGDTSRVRVLVTSREPLRVADEVHWRIGALLSAPDAGLLFEDRARLARPGIDLDPDAVTELCRQLDNMPLPIELAAARLRQLPFDTVLRSVRDRVGLLRNRTRGVDERHHSLQALLDWSHDLLPEDERRAFRSCAAFRSTFDAAAAATVCGLPRRAAADLLDVLAERSLLQVGGEAEPRFLMLMTIRDYAADRLAESGEGDEVAARHAAWIAGELGPLGDRRALQYEPDGAATLAAYAELYEDGLAALEWAESAGDDRLLAVLANALFDYWLTTGAYETGAHWLRLAGERGDARALGRAGTFVGLDTASAEAIELMTRACDLARAQGDEPVLGECLTRLGAQLARYTEGTRGEAECLEVIDLPGAEPIDKGGALLVLGIAASYREDYDTSIARYQEVLTLRATPNQIGIASSNIADVLIDRGDLAGAAELLTAALPLVEARDPSVILRVCTLLHRVALAEGDQALALHWLDRGLRSHAAVGAGDSPPARRLRELRSAVLGTSKGEHLRAL